MILNALKTLLTLLMAALDQQRGSCNIFCSHRLEDLKTEQAFFHFLFLIFMEFIHVCRDFANHSLCFCSCFCPDYRESHISPRGKKKKDASGSSANRCTWLSNGNAASLATGRRAWLQMKKGKGHGRFFCHFSPFPISKSVILTTLSFQRSQQRNENSARWSIPIDKREGISNLGRASFSPVHKGVERY